MISHVRRRRILGGMSLALFLISVVTIVLVVNAFAQRPELRSRFDATKTRAYSLSEQTMRLLGELDGEWTLALVLVRENVHHTARRQIEEVLDRYVAASDRITVQQIDPTDPRTIGEYERLLGRLHTIYADLAAQYDELLDQGLATFEDLLVVAQQHSGQLEQFVSIVQSQGLDAHDLAERARTLGLLADQGREIVREIENARRIADARPIPDYDTAHSVLAQILSASADEVYAAVEALTAWLDGAPPDPEVRQFLRTQSRELEAWARRLARALDPLLHLPPLELSVIGETLAEGEALVIVGPDRAAVIPSRQLFPRTNFRSSGAGGVSFDQRFRGEQLISAAMWSLQVEQMPKVIFVHAEEQSLMRQRDRNVDLLAAAMTLHAARYEVEEWVVGQMDRPDVPPDRRAVWIIVPPTQRSGLEPSRRELELLAATRALLQEGEAVLLNFYPSQLPRYGQRDPWATIARPLGIEIDTARAIFESIRTEVDRVQVQRGLAVQRFETSSLIGRAVHGQQTYFGLPVAVHSAAELPAGVAHEPVLRIQPGPARWLEAEWHLDPTGRNGVAPEKRFDEPLTLVMAIERPSPAGRGGQRAMIVGAGGWMLSFIVDAAIPIGGERLAMSNPGNRELLLSAVAWLAGLDELVAQSPLSQEVARLGEIGESAGRLWFWLLVVGMPGASLVLGFMVWSYRRF